ncbi:MAG: hypothetical protein H5U22_06550 [Rhizobium sp.]|nr:hypothetical protein [Rhizobium sp.]
MTGEQDPAGRIEAAIETRRAQKPIYTIAHGSAAVQAARIIAAVSEDRRKRAEAYYLAAEWHDKQTAACKVMAEDSPRLDSAIRSRAAANAVHHGASASGLRLAATQLLRSLATTS